MDAKKENLAVCDTSPGFYFLIMKGANWNKTTSQLGFHLTCIPVPNFESTLNVKNEWKRRTHKAKLYSRKKKKK